MAKPESGRENAGPKGQTIHQQEIFGTNKYSYASLKTRSSSYDLIIAAIPRNQSRNFLYPIK
jgi:hypothetical protein